MICMWDFSKEFFAKEKLTKPGGGALLTSVF